MPSSKQSNKSPSSGQRAPWACGAMGRPGYRRSSRKPSLRVSASVTEHQTRISEAPTLNVAPTAPPATWCQTSALRGSALNDIFWSLLETATGGRAGA